MCDKYLWRQVIILIASFLYCVSTGNVLVFPSVLTPGLSQANNTEIPATEHQVSWIITSNGFAVILGITTLPPIFQIFGRKLTYITSSLLLLIGWIIFSTANSVTALLAARIIQGAALGGIYVHNMSVGEYCDPKRRGYFMSCNKLGIAVGFLVIHALSLIFNWRQVAMFALIFPTVSLAMVLFWPESPYYLAMKGQFKQSEKSFIWLHGANRLQELHNLHLSQLRKDTSKSVKWYKFLLKKKFLKAFLIVSVLTLLLDLTGRHYFVIYIIQIMTKLIGDKSVAVYCSIASDALTIVALMSSTFIISYFKRRTILFSFGCTTVVLMLLICLVTVLKLQKAPWLAPALIILHNFIMNISITPICFTMMGEVFSLEYKGYGGFLNGIAFMMFYTLMLKLTPILLNNTGIGGVYAIYGISIGACLIVLYFIVPETKDRTLQEIEDELKDVENSDETLRL